MMNQQKAPRPMRYARIARTILYSTALWLLAGSVSAQPVATLAPNAQPQFLTAAGAVCASCTLETYIAGTSTPLATCASSSMSAAATCTTSNGTTITLNSAGQVPNGSLYLIPGLTYKFILKTSGGSTIWTQDNIGSLQHVSIDRLRLATNSVTIASGAITVSESQYAVDTESAASADDLDTITASTATGTGSLLLLTPANVSRVVTVRDGAGNIQLANGVNLSLNDSASSLLLYYNGSNWVEVSRSGPGQIDVGIVEGRLTLESGVPISTTDQTAKTTMYFTPYRGNRIALFDGTYWALYTFTQRELALGTLTDDLPYDVFIYNNSGTLMLEFTAWTNATTRATALTTQDGVYVKTGATTRRYLGTFRTETTTTTEDSLAKRFLWNYYNRVPRTLLVRETTDTWTYTTATYQQARGQASNQLAVVVGVAEVPITVEVRAQASNTNTGVNPIVAIGEDSATTKATLCLTSFTRIDAAGQLSGPVATLKTYPAIGYHFYAWLEQSTAAGTTTWYGDNGGTTFQTGIFGEIQG